MQASAIHKGEHMHATLSFAYPDDENKLKDALNGERYRYALEEIHQHIKEMYKDGSDYEFVITSISSVVSNALKGE